MEPVVTAAAVRPGGLDGGPSIRVGSSPLSPTEATHPDANPGGVVSEQLHELPLWPALPGRREPDLDRVAGHLRDALDVRAAVVSLVSAAGQVIPGAGGRWNAGRS